MGPDKTDCRESGMTLIEMALYGAVVSVVLLGAATVEGSHARAMAYSAAVKTRDDLLNSVRQLATSRTALQAMASAAANSTHLKPCSATGPSAANICNSMTFYPVALF